MVLKYQALHLSTRLALEEQSSGESADATPDDHAVVALASVDDLLRKRIVQTVANGVSIRRTCSVLPLEVLYSPTPPYPVNSSLSASSSAGLAPPSKAAPEAKSVEPRKSRRVISASITGLCHAPREMWWTGNPGISRKSLPLQGARQEVAHAR